MEAVIQETSNELFLIDLNKIIKSQKSKLVRRLPRFIINYLTKLVRQEEINQQLVLLRNTYGIDFIKDNIKQLNITLKCHGKENIPDSGRFIFACNHPLGAVDFFASLVTISEKFPDVKALVNDILLNFKNLQSLFLPVNVFGKSPEEYHRKINEAYASDIQILTFPSGEVSRERDGVIKDGPWHRSFIRNAIEYQRDVIPIYIHARNSERFYRLGRLRKNLGIRLNFELFLLPDEIFRQKDKTIQLVIGKPIPYQSFDESKSHLEWAQIVKEQLYKLKQKMGLNGHYS